MNDSRPLGLVSPQPSSNLLNTSHFASSPRSSISKSVPLLAMRMAKPRSIFFFLGGVNTHHYFQFLPSYYFCVSFNFMAPKHSSAPSFQTTELRDDLPRYDSLAGTLLVCSQLSWRPSLNRIPLRHLRDRLFREADIQSCVSQAHG